MMNEIKYLFIQSERKVKNYPHPALRATLCSASSVPLSRRARVCSPLPPGERQGVREGVDLGLRTKQTQASVGWAPCPRGQPLTTTSRDILLSKNCRHARYATYGSWACCALRFTQDRLLPTLRSLTMPQTVMVRADRVIE